MYFYKLWLFLFDSTLYFYECQIGFQDGNVSIGSIMEAGDTSAWTQYWKHIKAKNLMCRNSLAIFYDT